MASLLYRLGTFVTSHRRRIQALWLIALLAVGAVAGGFAKGTTDEFRIPGTPSQAALDQLNTRFPELSGVAAQVVIETPSGTSVRDAKVKAAVASIIARMEATDHVVMAADPYETDGWVSDDQRAAIINVQLDVQLDTVTDAIKESLTQAARVSLPTGTTAVVGGQAFGSQPPKMSATELAGLAVALVVLMLMFGSVFLAGLPMITALVGAAGTMLVITAATSVVKLSSTTPLLALMIGLAVGIDYALLVLVKHRENLRKGEPPHEAAARALATAGSAVVFAGLTVAIALSGLLVSKIPFLGYMGLAATAAVLLAVLTVLTLLPTFMVSPWAVRALTRRRETKRRGFASRWVGGVTRHPWLASVAVVAALVTLASPALNMRLALPDSGSADAGTGPRVAYDTIDRHFGPGFNSPLVVTSEIVTSTDPLGLVDDMKTAVSKLPGVDSVLVATPNRGADTAVLIVVPTDGSESDATHELVQRVRALSVDGHALQVTGTTAVQIDVTDRLGAALLPFALIVMGLSLLILLVVFRSIAVPVTATIGFLLSVTAAFGVVWGVFGEGYLGELFAVDRTGPVISFLPIILIGVLFGLAMDYQVFLVARMHEEYARTRNAHESIDHGFTQVAPVITAAAVIMISVFAFFMASGDTIIKPMALGLASGVFTDAFLVRLTLVPALLQVLGDRAWSVPRWLDRVMPSIDVEGAELERMLEARDRAGTYAHESGPSGEPRTPAVAAAEWRRVRRGPRGLATVIALAVIPALYAGTLVWANLDPTGQLRAVRVAVVNQDVPVDIALPDGTSTLAPMGRQLVAALVQSADEPTFDWYLTDAVDARHGLKTGDYAAVVTIPADFSAAVTSPSGSAAEARSGVLDIRTNDATGYTPASIARSVGAAAANAYGEQVSATMLRAMFGGFGQLATGLSDAADGAAKLDDGTSALADGLGRLSDGVSALPSGTSKLNAGAGKLADGASALSAGVAQLAAGLAALEAGTKDLPTQVSGLAAGVHGVAQGVAGSSDGAASLADGLDTNAAGVAGASSACAASGASPEFCSQLAALASSAAGLSSGASDLADGLDALDTAASSLDTGAAALADGVPALASGIAASADGAGALADGSAALARGAGSLSSGTAKLAHGMGALADGAASAADGAAQLADGTSALASGLRSAADQAPAYTGAQAKALASALAAPVVMHSTRINAVPSYGYGIAPYFIAIGLWVGAFALWLVLRPLAGGSALRAAAGAYLPAAVLAALQAAAVWAVLRYALHLTLADPIGLALLIALAALSFTAVNQALGAAFGVAGRFVAILLAVVQLAAAGAVYPITTAPAFLQAVHPMLPMTHVVDAARSLIAGGTSNVFGAVAVLTMWLVGAWLVTLLAAHLRHGRVAADAGPAAQA